MIVMLSRNLSEASLPNLSSAIGSRASVAGVACLASAAVADWPLFDWIEPLSAVSAAVGGCGSLADIVSSVWLAPMPEMWTV
jgi:hypothetical protein